MARVSLLGVLIGSVTDIILSATSFWVILSLWPVTINPSSSQYQRLAEQALLASPPLFLATLLAGNLASIVGGYLAARIARRHELLNGGFASVLCVGSGLYGLATGEGAFPLWLQVLSLILSPCLAVLGGYLCRRGRNAP